MIVGKRQRRLHILDCARDDCAAGQPTSATTAWSREYEVRTSGSVMTDPDLNFLPRIDSINGGLTRPRLPLWPQRRRSRSERPHPCRYHHSSSVTAGSPLPANRPTPCSSHLCQQSSSGSLLREGCSLSTTLPQLGLPLSARCRSASGQRSEATVLSCDAAKKQDSIVLNRGRMTVHRDSLDRGHDSDSFSFISRRKRNMANGRSHSAHIIASLWVR